MERYEVGSNMHKKEAYLFRLTRALLFLECHGLRRPPHLDGPGLNIFPPVDLDGWVIGLEGAASGGHTQPNLAPKEKENVTHFTHIIGFTD